MIEFMEESEINRATSPIIFHVPYYFSFPHYSGSYVVHKEKRQRASEVVTNLGSPVNAGGERGT